MPVGPSHGASGHDASTFMVLTSSTCMVLVPSLLTKILPLIDKDLALAVARRAFRAVVLELRRADDVAGLGIERHGGADGPAVIGEDDPVGEILVHDAVETTGGNAKLLDHRQGLEIEQRHRRVTAACDESAARVWGQGPAAPAG